MAKRTPLILIVAFLSTLSTTQVAHAQRMPMRSPGSGSWTSYDGLRWTSYIGLRALVDGLNPWKDSRKTSPDLVEIMKKIESERRTWPPNPHVPDSSPD